MKKKFSIIGGGIVGCLTAIYLKNSGHEVEIYEKNNELGGVLKDHKYTNSVYLKGCQYFNTYSEWFTMLQAYIPNNFNSFKFNYGSVTELNRKSIYTKKFAIPLVDIGVLKEEDFKKSNNKITTLEDKINLYPSKVQTQLNLFLNNCGIEAKKFPETITNNLQISRIHILNNDEKIFKLKRDIFFDNILALERGKIYNKDLSYSLPSNGYSDFFEKLLKVLKEKNITVYLNSHILTKWKNKKLEIFANEKKISQDYIFWSGNPTNIIRQFNSKKLDSHVFKNIQINSDLNNNIKKNIFIQIFSKKSKILRIHLYNLNNISKLSIECLFNKEDPNNIIEEARKYLSNYNLDIDINKNSINKNLNSRFDIFTLNDSRIIENFLNLTNKTNLLYSPWLIYGREEKIKKIIENLKLKKII